MNSRHAMSKALKGCDRGEVAKAMGLSMGSLNNQIAGELPYRPKGQTLNFVERVVDFMAACESDNGELVLLEWLAEEFGCIIVRNPAIRATGSPVITKIAGILKDFTGVVDEISTAAEDLLIDRYEAEGIRAKWEIMKRATEEFVLACETGVYDTDGCPGVTASRGR